MANQEPFSFNRKRNVGEKAHHAGNIPVERGGERPVREFDNTPLPDAVDQGLVQTPDSTNHPALQEVQVAPAVVSPEVKKKTSKIPLWAKLGAGALTLSAAVTAGAVVHTAVKANNAIKDIVDQNTGAPEVPGASEDSDPANEQLDPPEWEAFNFPYEEAIKPAELSSDQLEQWNSGDSQARNEIVDQLLRDRTSYALTDLWRTQETGQTPDLSYITHDPEVVETLKSAIGLYPEQEGVDGISVCPLDSSEYSIDQMCHPAHYATPNNFAPGTGEKVIVHTNMITSENAFVDNPDLFKGLELQFHPEVDENGVLTWVHN